MKKPFAFLASLLLIFSLCACNLPRADTPVGMKPEIDATKGILTLAVTTLPATLQPPLSSPTLKLPTSTPTIALSPTSTPTITLTPTITFTLAPTNTPVPKPGTIAGTISGYPYGSLPSLTIVAYGQDPPFNYSYMISSPGDTFYSMTSSYMLPGRYQVVAYDSSDRSGACSAIVAVVSEQTVTCNITNWGGGYRARPSGVPGP
jgi:hypothetical protein